MEVKIYNSLTNKLEVFKPIKENEVSMYVCGPTVYNHAHIGNARPLVFFDVLRRFFIYLGYKVNFVSNFTDVDDKIINQAIKENTNEKEIANKYIEAFKKVTCDLHSLLPDVAPRVTDTMDEIISFIKELEDKGYAYNVNGNVYFRVNKVKGYGKLSNINKEDLEVGARIEENKEKESPLDFALWKNTDVGIKWDSPFGRGRPGWHTECVVMINQIYKNHLIDIHGGGNDLKFPHHENEIAQSNALYNTDIATYWIHNAMINVDGQKMSKSLGNFRYAKDLISEYGGNVIRMMLLSAPYRSPCNFSDEAIKTASLEMNKIINSIKQASLKLQLSDYKDNKYSNEIVSNFLNELANDVNVANGFTVLYDAIKKLNVATRNNNINEISLYFNTITQINKILGFDLMIKELTNEEKKILSDWEKAKANKEFDKADEYRKVLMDKGVL